MASFGFWSVIPPVVAIILAIRTKQVYIALVFGIWMGWLVISNFNPFNGTLATIKAFVDVFKDEGNTRTIMFSALVGALLVFIQRSGGVDGFILKINKLTVRLEKKSTISNKVLIQVLATCTGMLLFVETSICALTVGSLFRPLFDKNKISREKLAYIADSISAPTAILIPFNAWGAFVMGLLVTQGFDRPFQTMFSALPYNFYPMFAILFVFFVILSKKDFKLMAKAEKRVRETGKLLNDGARPMISSEITNAPRKESVKPKARNMVIPMAVMVGCMPFYLAFTGWNAIEEPLSFFQHVFTAIGQGSGSASVLYSVLSALGVAMILYRVQKIFKTKEMVDLALKGISGLLPLALLMMLAFAISSVCKQLGTGIYIANLSKDWLTPSLVPAIVFVVSAFVAFSTGTSWGTFAIMMSISVPMAQTLDVSVP